MLKLLDQMFMTKSLPNWIYMKQKHYGLRMNEHSFVEKNINFVLEGCHRFKTCSSSCDRWRPSHTLHVFPKTTWHDERNTDQEWIISNSRGSDNCNWLKQLEIDKNGSQRSIAEGNFARERDTFSEVKGNGQHQDIWGQIPWRLHDWKITS